VPSKNVFNDGSSALAVGITIAAVIPVANILNIILSIMNGSLMKELFAPTSFIMPISSL